MSIFDISIWRIILQCIMLGFTKYLVSFNIFKSTMLNVLFLRVIVLIHNGIKFIAQWTWHIAVKVTLHEQNDLKKSKRIQLLDLGFRLLTTLAATLTLVSIIRFPEKRLYSYNVTYCVYFSLVLLSLIIETVNSYLLIQR